MPLEIERKFLVYHELLPEGMDGVPIKQGYLHSDEDKSIRVRIMGHKSYLTIKGRDIQGSRPEFEYEIPYDDGIHLYENFTNAGRINKIRFHLLIGHHLWEVDKFLDDNQGLWLAEVELNSADEEIVVPSWVKKEVTGNPRYLNSYLANHPFTSWVAQ